MKFSKRWQRWLGIMMTVVLVTGPLQAFSYAAETRETAVGAEAVAGGEDIDPAEEDGPAAEYSDKETAGEAEQEGDPADEDAADGEDGSAAEDADLAEDADSAEDARDQSDDRGRDFSDDEEEETYIYEEEGSEEESREEENGEAAPLEGGKEEIVEEAADEETDSAASMAVTDSGTCGDNAYYELDDNGVLTISGTGEVTSNPWYRSGSGNQDIKSIVIEEGITKLCNDCFSNCGQVTDVSFPRSLETIGKYCFKDCYKLKGVPFTDEIKEIRSYAFENCTALEIVELPEGLIELESQIFLNCTSLSRVYIGRSVSSYTMGAFTGCSSLAQIDVSSEQPYLLSINGVLFSNTAINKQLILYPRGKEWASYTVPSGIQSISAFAFNGCNNLKYLSIADSVTTIDSRAIYQCRNLETLRLGKMLKYLGAGAIEECDSLTELEFPARLETLDRNVLAKNKALNTITFRGSAPSFDFDAFKGISAKVYYPRDQAESFEEFRNTSFEGATLDWQLYDAERIDVLYCKASLSQYNYVYDGNPKEPSVTAEYNGEPLSYIDGDYTVTYYDNISAGTGRAVIEGKYEYTGSTTRNFTISKAEPTLSFSGTNVVKTLLDSAFTNALTKTTDGTVSFSSSNSSVAAVDSSTGEVTIKGTGSATITASAEEGNNYKAGTASYTLTVRPYDISGKIRVGLSSTSMVYTGEELTPDVTIYIGTEALTEHQDYEIEFEDNINAGNAKILITGKGNYTGSGWTAFSITKAAPALAFENASVTKMMFGSDFTNTLTMKTDGTVAFTSDNASVAEVDSETGKVTIKGIGDATITVSASEGANYTAGTAEYTLIVEPYGISACTVTIPAESYDYTGRAAEPTPTIKRGTATLVPETDYTVAYTDNLNAGTATITATGIGEYTGTVSKTFTIAKIEPSLAFAEASVSKTTADAAFTNELTKSTDGAVTFNSDNTAVAEVDSTTGQVTIKGAGTATITAAAAEGTNHTAGSASYTLTVTEAGGSLSLEDLTYSFANSAFSFGYPKDYVIPLSSYQAIFGNTTKAAWYYKIQSTWGGSCMGFSSTAALLYDPDNGLYPSGFNSGAGRISDLNVQDENSSIGMNVTQFIEAMQISQKTQQVKDAISSNRVYTTDIKRGNNNLNGLYSTVQGQTEAKKPVIIAVYQNGGHAILAYKAEDVSGAESRIYVYDNNFPSSERYITLNKDDSGNYTSWSYDMGGYYGTWGTSNSSSSISYIPYSVIEHVWANRGDVNEIQNVVRFNSRNIALFDGDNRLAATIVDGQILTNNSRIRLVEDDLEAGGSSDDGYTLVSMPIDVYTVKNLDSNTESLDLAVVDTNLGASVDTTAKEVTFIVDDSNDLNSILIKAEEDDKYSIVLNSSFDHDDHNEVEIKGYGMGETLEVSREDGYININNCQILNITVDGVDVKKYTVSASSGEGGSITPSGESAVIRDMDTTYTITPDSGYVIEDVKVDGKSVGAVTSYTFKQVRADHTISASFKKNVTLPGKTTRGDMFNLANNVKVTWKAVQGAKYYKVYREGITDPAETRKEPVIVTAGLVGWDKDPGLTNGHAYRYKIVASLTGKGDSSGDSKLSYSKVMYRLKTVVIRSVKNLEPGKVTVKYDRTTSGDSYVLQYSENQDMTGARTKVVLGASNTSYVIGGLKKGKTYYISIRVRKKVNGIDYYTTFGVPKKVTVTK